MSQDSLAGELAELALRVNAFIASAALLPIPGIDGGPLLKWSLVLASKSQAQADQVDKRLNGYLGGGLLAAMLASLKQRRWFPAFLQGLLGAAASSIALGWLKES